MTGSIDIEIIERQLDRVQSFIPRIDGRSTGYLAILSGQLALAFTNINSTDISGWFLLTCLVMFLGCTVWAFINIYQCSHPNIDGPKKSLIFFSEIEKMSVKEYTDAFLSATEDDLKQDLLNQIHRNSQIVSQKYGHLRAASASMLLGSAPWAILLLGASIKNYRLPLLP
ncbi:Pycsar system effector family protein [Brucella anthropi]|uniref:Pycsar effector protein domain-containing protein n=1 Tax=Brucella anthropi TaxID=529 RepID=A0A6L3YZ59_BRUAN|nr:Pycsar system effector family protein [Brucella anthropi]KAB2761973.1 hypothetical protein F9L04_22980 [Brucella anthropi]UVV66689.1 DUF5706 domain-containing protein [Brucella anthropi]